MIDQEQYLDTSECAKLLSRSPGAVRNLVMRRAIPYRKPGGRLMFKRSEIEAWIDNADGLTLEQMQGGRQ